MTIYAKIDGANNKVQTIILADKNFIDTQIGTWIECTGRQPNTNSTYNSDLDKFIPIKPYDSWTLNNDKTEWICPKEMPTIDENSELRPVWNEGTQDWEML